MGTDKEKKIKSFLESIGFIVVGTIIGSIIISIIALIIIFLNFPAWTLPVSILSILLYGLWRAS